RTVWSPSVSMPTDRTWNVGSKLQVVAALAAGAMPSAPASTAVAVAMRAPVRMPRSLRLRGHAQCQEVDARRVELLGREHAPDAVAKPETLGRGHGQVPVAAADVGAAVHDGNADGPVAVAEGDLRAARHGLGRDPEGALGQVPATGQCAAVEAGAVDRRDAAAVDVELA